MNRKLTSLIVGGFIATLGVLNTVQNASARFVPGENVDQISKNAPTDNTPLTNDRTRFDLSNSQWIIMGAAGMLGAASLVVVIWAFTNKRKK